MQHTATHYNTLQHTATHCNTMLHTATHYNTLLHTATCCNTLQHTAPHLKDSGALTRSLSQRDPLLRKRDISANSPILHQKSPISSFLRKRALFLAQFCMRIPTHSSARELSPQKSPTSPQRSPVLLQKSPISLQTSPVPQQKSAIPAQKSLISCAFFFFWRVLAHSPDLVLKESYFSSKDPYIQSWALQILNIGILPKMLGKIGYRDLLRRYMAKSPDPILPKIGKEPHIRSNKPCIHSKMLFT